jgi:hypothetical protein
MEFLYQRYLIALSAASWIVLGYCKIQPGGHAGFVILPAKGRKPPTSLAGSRLHVPQMQMKSNDLQQPFSSVSGRSGNENRSAHGIRVDVQVMVATGLKSKS